MKKHQKSEIQNLEEKFENYLKKFEFYSFCDKFADFTNSYDKMKEETKHKIENLYEKISSEVLS